MSYFLMVLQMIPAILGIVKQVENLIPGQGQGKAKLDMVMSTVNAAAQGEAQVAKAIEGRDLNATVSSIVGASVSVLNAAGIFKKP